MTKRLEFIFDFASLNAYLAFRALPPLLERTGAELVLIPCLLGGLFKATGNRAPFEAFGGVKGKLEYEMLEIKRFIAKHELTHYRMNPHFPVNTLMLMRGLVAARLAGAEAAYVEMGLAGMWEEGLKLDDPAVLAARVTAAGLDAEPLFAAAQSPEVKRSLIETTEESSRRGAFGIPTFFVGSEMFFGKERLGQVEEELMKGGL
jgi:2-hydroxychromene-2-carboxylate isomerase